MFNGSGKSLEMRFESIGVGSEAKQRVTGRYRSCCSALTPWRLVVLRHKIQRSSFCIACTQGHLGSILAIATIS